MTNAERLQQTYNNLIAQRQKLSESPKPNIQVDGERYDWGDYMEMLTKQIAVVKAELEAELGTDIVEEHTTAWT